MSKKNILIPAAILSAVALAVPGVAVAKPSISVTSDPQCAGFSLTAESPGDAFTGGQYTVTAQEYDSETVTPTGETRVFTGSAVWGDTVTVTIPAADDYLLWTYRVGSSADGEGVTTYGERQLDCRPVEQPEPEPEPEEPGDEVPEPETPEVEEPETPDAPEAPELPTADEDTTTPVVT